MLPSFTIREAKEEDLPALVQVHVTSWNATYPDFHPKPSAPLRESQWRKAFQERADDWFCYVVEKEEGIIVGFVTGHNFHDPELPYKGQLDKIHIYKAYHRLGLGSKLVGFVARRFIAQGIHSMILFADPENANIKFYDVLEGERLLDKEGIFQGAFGWRDISKLAEL